MKSFITGLIIILSALPAVAETSDDFPTSNRELLELLDTEIARRDDYIGRRNAKVDSVKALIALDSLTVGHYFALGDLMGGLNADSAISVFSRGYDVATSIGDSVSAQRFKILRVTEMGKFGSAPDAIRDIGQIGRHGIYPENNALYFEVCRDLYYMLAEVFEHTGLHDNYMTPGLGFAYKLQTQLPSESYEARFNQSLISYARGNDAMFLATLHDIASDVPTSHDRYSMYMTSLGGRYLIIGRNDDAIRYLALAAIDDLRDGDRQGTALIRLGSALHGEGDIARAHNYLSVSLEEALAGGAKTNCLMISEALMPVAQKLHDSQRHTLFMLIGLIVSLLAGVMLLFRLYQVKKNRTQMLEATRQQLAHANLTKEAYISEFMNLSSSYMESLEDFNRVSKRKITAGQTDDLLEMIKSGKIMEDQRKKFDDIFDDAFLGIYPTFIDDVNRLLLPDKQIVTSAPNVLTTELRVLAFSRLGIDDSAQVARFLGVTLNTIYTYRNKLRNKAIARETFDADVMKIGAID